ncbi:type 1 glutamine amidotransferase [Pseudemcibacter aquimaris]|uniref:type 1 glutamine amidotransferase n=1 Tax=Pseudemcibacter aquimaris TaxID=2857064 RepID=UPI0020123669|nr:type 1 glutamine amidotransferase [Pseudemcibacter aquimaris]MCC3862103.1 type 1 glutamine amidotransferase [Pseudemcibacter aquimaris]WDU58856.1 type 1 glutamine amidotransferase [Pseudemcibacter aquimaris]
MKLLIVEGNTAEARDQAVAAGSMAQSTLYHKTLEWLKPGISCDIVYPADGSVGLPDADRLNNYAGVVWTGSSLNIYEDDPAITRQVDFMKLCFESGAMIFGSCWGLQMAVVATGGTVVKNEKGREVGIARDIAPTHQGENHPMFGGKRGIFDANAIHLDHVEKIPEGATVLAGNEMSEVQAIEIKRGDAIFWGVQYHPEFDLEYMSYIVRKYKQMMVDEDICESNEAAEKLSSDYLAVHNDQTRKDIIENLEIGEDVLDPCLRLKEIGNWLDFIEKPLN